jgi:transposase
LLTLQRPEQGGALSWQAVAERLQARVEQVEAENCGLRVVAARAGELEASLSGALAANEALAARADRLAEELATLRRMLFGRRSEKGEGGGAAAGDGADPAAGGGPDPEVGGQGGGGGDPDAAGLEGDKGEGRKRRGQRRGAPGPRRRDYSGLPTVEFIYDLDEDQKCCPECGIGFDAFDEQVFEQVDWRVVVVRLVHRRRRYTRSCRCGGPRVVTAPGPVKAIGKGRFTSGFLARLVVAKFLSGQPVHRITIGLARDGLGVPDSTLTGALEQVGQLLEPLQTAIAARNRTEGHLHVDETTWKVFEAVEGKSGTRWWLWVFVGVDTVCFVMDSTRSTQVATQHLGLDLDAGKLTTRGHLVVSSDFYVVYQSIDKQIEAITALWCWAHVRRFFVRAGDAHPDQLRYWSRQWIARIRALYVAHRALAVALRAAGLTTTGQAATGHQAGTATDVITTQKHPRYPHPILQAADASAPTSTDTTGQDTALVGERALVGEPAVVVTCDVDLDSGAVPAVQAAQRAFDDALAAIDQARQRDTGSPGLHPAAKKVIATLNREWPGLIAHRDFPLLPLDNNAAERALRTPVVGRKNYSGSQAKWAAHLAARAWTITATIELAGLNPITYLTAYLDACGANGSKPLAGADLQRFLPWAASETDLQTWSAPPRHRPGPGP